MPIVPALPSSSRMAMRPVPNLVRRIHQLVSTERASSPTSTRWNGQLPISRGQSGSGRVMPVEPFVTASQLRAMNWMRRVNAIVMMTNAAPRLR